MEAILPILFATCFFGGSLALIVGVIVFAVARSRKKGEQLVKIGAALGLHHEGGRRIAGSRNGAHVVVRHVTEGSGDNRSSWTYTEAEIDPPLRLGLNVRRQGWLGTAFADLFGASDLTIGDPAFDASFTINAIEAGEVGRLFDAQLKPVLSRAHAGVRRLWMTDEKVHASFSGFSVDQRQITAYLDTVTEVALAAREARRRMGPTAREREVLASWGGLATMSGWRFDRERLVLEGTSGRHRFQVVPTLDQKGWSTRFRVTFDRPLGVALILRKEFALAKVGRLFGMTDIELGDPQFDDAFRIKGSDADGVRHVLGDASLRASLLHLFAAARSLEVQDDSVDAVAAGLVSDTEALTRSLGLVVAVADGLRARVDAPRVGAYR